MREPIKPEDIQAGDHIRVEWLTTGKRLPGALEYVAPHSGTAMRKRMSEAEHRTAKWFLLERPVPTVDLPAENTLGFMGAAGTTYTGVWRKTQGHMLEGAVTEANYTSECWSEYSVTSFVEAVAVPKAALDELRRDHSADLFEIDLDTAVVKFLDAVDAANGDPR